MNHALAAALTLALVIPAASMQAAELTGVWTWSYAVNQQHRESTLRLKFDSEGNWLSGTFQASDNHWPIPITKASYDDGIFQIVARSTIGGKDYCVTFSGTSGGGDTIIGKCHVQYGERIQKLDWVARRLK